MRKNERRATRNGFRREIEKKMRKDTKKNVIKYFYINIWKCARSIKSNIQEKKKR